MTKAARFPLLASALLLLGGGAAMAENFQIGDLRIINPWAPAAPATAPAIPGYLTIVNTGRSPDRIVAGSFVEARQFTINSSATPGSIVIPPGATVTLQPGGDHLQFSNLRGPIEAGMEVQSIIKFENAGPLVLKFTIQGAPARTGSTGKRAPR